MKISSPDYCGKMTEEEAKADFLRRIENYKLQYHPLDEESDDELSYIKVPLSPEIPTRSALLLIR